MHDIHTHLYMSAYDQDRDAVLKRAQEAGVEQIFAIGCNIEESQQSVVLAERYPQIFASVGIHPYEFNTETARQKYEAAGGVSALRTLAQQTKVVAIGECGLDYYTHDPAKPITDEQKTYQQAGFSAQMQLAEGVSLPLIVHCRDAYDDMLAMLRAQGTKLPAIILHCYMGDTEMTRKFLALPNVYFSFAGNITYPVKRSIVGTKDDLTETVRMVPLDRIFAETDCPFLAPQPKRGTRSEPAYVALVAAAIADWHGMDHSLVIQQVNVNVQRIFGNGNKAVY